MQITPYTLPDKYPVNNVDYLQLLFHNILIKKGRPGNIVRTIFFSKSIFPEELIRQSLAENILLQWLNSYHIETGFWNSPRNWVLGRKAVPIGFEIVYAQNTQIPTSVLNHPLFVDGSGLFFLHLVLFPNGGSALVFSVNHCFTDFKGVQQLSNMLTGNLRFENSDIFLSSPDITPRFSTKLKESLKIVAFLLKTQLKNVAVIGNRRLESSFEKQINNYSVLHCSVQESIALNKEIEKENLALHPNTFFISKALLALQHANLMPKKKLLWVSVPVNSHKKGGRTLALFGNNLRFLFYRISTQKLFDIQNIFSEIKNQHLEQIKNDFPKKYSIMATWWKNLPMPIYALFVKMPTMGVVSSLSFSNLGNNFQDVEDIYGCTVSEIVNLPSNPSPPDIGIVVMMRKDCYSFVLTWMDGLISEKEAALVLKHIV